MTQPIPMYQGEDFSQELSYFTDINLTTPVVFTNPVMDVRDPQTQSLIATFDESGLKQGLCTITGPGVLILSMGYIQTALIPARTYPLDIFADVGSRREAITKRGTLKLHVSARVTVDVGL